MNTLKDFIKNELYGWKLFEVLWLVISTTTILGLSIYWKDTLVGIITGITGVICVILTGKGKVSSYIFGMVNTVLYAYVAFGAKYYGEVMLNLLYYMPMNIVGWILWKKHMNAQTQEVMKQKLKVKGQVLVGIICAISVFLYGLFLGRLGGSLPYVDSLSVVASIVAQILCVKRYMEQWVLWIVVDTVSVIMWVVVFVQGGENISTLLMWIVYLLNAIFMFLKWYKESKGAELCMR